MKLVFFLLGMLLGIALVWKPASSTSRQPKVYYPSVGYCTEKIAKEFEKAQKN